MIVLTKVVQDRDGQYHYPNEPLEVKTIVRRLADDKDDRAIINVLFSNGVKGAVFSEEITEKE